MSFHGHSALLSILNKGSQVEITVDLVKYWTVLKVAAREHKHKVRVQEKVQNFKISKPDPSVILPSASLHLPDFPNKATNERTSVQIQCL